MTTAQDLTKTYGAHTTMSGRTYPTTNLSDGRTLMLSKYGWAIIEGDGQAGSDEIRDEAWGLQGEWLNTL